MIRCSVNHIKHACIAKTPQPGHPSPILNACKCFRSFAIHWAHTDDLSEPSLQKGFCGVCCVQAHMSCGMTKPTKWLCAKRRLRSAWTSAQSDQSLRYLQIQSYPLSAQRRLWSDWADAQADLSLRWAHSHFVGFVMSWLIWRTNYQNWEFYNWKATEMGKKIGNCFKIIYLLLRLLRYTNEEAHTQYWCLLKRLIRSITFYSRDSYVVFIGWWVYIVKYSVRAWRRSHELESASPPYERVSNISQYKCNNLFIIYP